MPHVILYVSPLNAKQVVDGSGPLQSVEVSVEQGGAGAGGPDAALVSAVLDGGGELTAIWLEVGDIERTVARLRECQ